MFKIRTLLTMLTTCSEKGTGIQRMHQRRTGWCNSCVCVTEGYSTYIKEGYGLSFNVCKREKYHGMRIGGRKAIFAYSSKILYLRRTNTEYIKGEL